MVKPRIGIITALAKECWAMKALLESVTEVSVEGRGAGRRYYVGEIPARDGGKHTVALCLSGVGNNSAAIRASEMFQHFGDIDSVIMVGIAGGVPNPSKAEDHVRLGDIVVSSEGGVTQYDLGKEIATTIDAETTVELHETSRPRPPDPILLEAVELLEVEEYDDKRPWLEHIKRVCDRFNVLRPPSETDVLYSTEDPTKVIDHPDDSLRIAGQPRLFIGTIASGNVVLKNPVRRDYLRDEFRVKAVEMEGSGIADAAWKKKVGYLVVRGICDYCDSHKNDAWQKYAAIAAAGYARALIESLPTSDQFRQDGPPNATVDEYLLAVNVFSESGTYITLPGPSSFAYVPLLLRRKNPKKSDELEIPLVLNGVLNDEPYVMFVGSGGAGKSTLLRRIARDAWDSPESLGLPRRYLPMVIRLSAFARTEEIVIEKLLKDALYKAGELSLPGDLPEGFFNDWSKEVGSPWFLLFDGLDEVAADERPSLITQLSNMLDTIKGNGHRAALTTRPGEFAVSLESKLTPFVVLGFTSQQQREFAKNCFGADAEIFLSQIDRLDADDLNGNPLLFTIAAVVFLHDRQLSTNKTSLYERFIQIWLEEATVRGLKNELGDDLYELVSSALEQLAFEMTDRPDDNLSIVLSRKLGIYLKDNLQVPLPKALEQGRRLVDVLGTRSGMFVKTGRICDWAHGNFREYLAGRAMDTQLLGSSDDYEKVLGERPFDSKWFEAVSTLVQVNSKSTEILKWIAGRAASRADAESALLVHYYWTQTLNQNDPQTVEAVVDALMVGLADTQTGLNPPRRIKQALVEMGHPAVPALLAALSRLNNLQKELFPEWRGKKPPDVHTESGKKVYQSSRQRQGIVEVFGQINDARTFDPLVSLLDEDEFDSNRVHVRRAAQKALACIGYAVIEPLLEVIRDSSHSTEKRHQALVALKLVGRRTDQVSQTLAECFREGLTGNHQLLDWSLFAATGLRDRNQSDFAAETLKLNNQELVARAADFFSAMPSDAPLKDLANSLERWNEMEAHSFSSSFGFRSLLTALVQTGEQFAYQLVRKVIVSSLRGEGQFHDALTEAGKLPIAGLRRLILTSSLAQLRQPTLPVVRNRLITVLRRFWTWLLSMFVRKHRQRKQHRYNFRLADAVSVLGSTWRVDQLTDLVKATRRIEAVVPTGVDDIISTYSHKREAGSQMYLVDQDDLVHAFAKCQVRHFGQRIGRFLEAADWDFERELSDVLWVAGDPKAEEPLVNKLTKIRAEHSESNDRIPELYHVMRALGMCGSAKGVDKIIETVLEMPNINIEFSNEVLWPLLKRRVLDPQRLITLADNSSTHEYARYFFVIGLGYFDAPAFSDFFVRMVADEDERVKANAAQFLGWSNEPGTVAVLTDLLQKTQSSFVAECAAGALRRREASEASVEIIKAIERFGPTRTVGLLREAALLKNPSVVKYLKDITRKNEGTPWERDDLLHAVGEFYDQPWARTILEEWLENTGRRYDTGQQRLAFKVLAERDPNKLLAQAIRLYDENGLEDSAQSRLIVLLRQLFRSENVNSALLVPMLKRLLCDEELATRESVAEELIYLEPTQRLQIYEELTNMGNEWAQACGVYSLAFWDSDESEIERMRYAPVHIVRYFADRALTIRRKRPHLQQLAESFAKTVGVARVSSYLVLMQEGSEQFLHYLDEQIEDDRITEVFLPHMQSLVQSTTKKRQDTLMKEEEDLFCKSARQVQFH